MSLHRCITIVIALGISLTGAVGTSYAAVLPKAVFTNSTPNPASGPELVELRVDNALTQRVFVPIMSKAPPPTPVSDVGEPPIPQTVDTFNMQSWQVSNDAGQNYTLPAALPALPIGTRVRIYFDGTGPTADDYDLSDGLVVLHTPAGLVNVLDNSNGQVSLYSSSTHSTSTLRARQAWAVLGGGE